MIETGADAVQYSLIAGSPLASFSYQTVTGGIFSLEHQPLPGSTLISARPTPTTSKTNKKHRAIVKRKQKLYSHQY